MNPATRLMGSYAALCWTYVQMVGAPALKVVHSTEGQDDKNLGSAFEMDV